MQRLWTDAARDLPKFRKLLWASPTITGWYRDAHEASSIDKIPDKLAKQLNSATINLVPDRADINKAIEHMRRRVREALAGLAKHQEPRGADHDARTLDAI